MLQDILLDRYPPDRTGRPRGCSTASSTAKNGDKSVEVGGPVFATDSTDPNNQIVFLGQKGKDVECRFGKESLKGRPRSRPESR